MVLHSVTAVGPRPRGSPAIPFQLGWTEVKVVIKDSPPAEHRWGSFIPVLAPVAKGHPADRGVGTDAPIDTRHGLATLCPPAERKWDSGVNQIC